MAPRGYTDATLVAGAMGVTLTAPQLALVPGLVESVEALIDRYTGHAWMLASPVTDEFHPAAQGFVYLDHPPVLAVTAVSVRSSAIGALWVPLVAGEGYSLVDAGLGLLVLSGYPADAVINTESVGDAAFLRASYTHASPSALPADIRYAATLAVASWLGGGAGAAAAAGVKSVAFAQSDLVVTYQDQSASAAAMAATGLPAEAAAILRLHRRAVFA